MRGAAAILAVALLVSCAPSRAVRTDQVRIFDFPDRAESQWGYAPTTIQVAKGTRVTFTNGGSQFHTVTSDDPTRAFDAGVDPGSTAAIVFDKAGTWAYHCGVHPDMKGAVEVCDGACR